MNNNRRFFLKNTSLLATYCMVGNPLKSFAGAANKGFLSGNTGLKAIEIMHTAHLHGRVSSFAFGNLDATGGLNNVRTLVKNINTSSLLVDAGGFLGDSNNYADDINMIGMMNTTNYAAATVGEHELLKGEAHLASLVETMNFALVNCNYSFSNTVLQEKVLPYHIVHYGKYKIGITGVGPKLNGISFSEPYNKANEIAGYLKNEMNCDLVICLSQLGYKHANGQPDNRTFAKASRDIDVIVGGSGKVFTPQQVIAANRENQQVVISTAGYGGSVLGKLTFKFNNKRNMQGFTCENYIPGSSEGTSFGENYRKLTA